MSSPSAGGPCQLTYTSYDGGSRSGGGWQVKELRGAPSDAQREAMLAGVATRFDLVEPLPSFPTPRDVAALPRRLLYAPTDTGRAGYWHTVPAGPDASGRPGNVFAHVVLAAEAGGPEEGNAATRPVDLWRSGDWLVPYGSEEVSAAVLPPVAAPRAGNVVDRHSTVRFLLDPGTWRMGILAVLLDAVAAAMEGGPTVVLGVPDCDTAAMWIGAVSHLMSQGTADRFGWCTYDRHSLVDQTAARGAHLIAVPRVDLDRIPADEHRVILDEQEDPEPGELGGEPHRTGRGSTVVATAWSALVQTVLLDEESALAVLGRVDALAAAVGDSGLAPAWPLAMAVATDPQLRDGLAEARVALARYTPARIRDHADLYPPALDAVEDALPGEPEAVWSLLSGADGLALGSSGPGSLRYELTAQRFVADAARDPSWLVSQLRAPESWESPASQQSSASAQPGPGGGFPAALHWPPDAVPADLRATVDAAVEGLVARGQELVARGRDSAGPVEAPEAPEAPEALEEPEALAARVLALLDLFAHAGLLSGAAEDGMHRAVETVVLPLLCDAPRGARLVAAMRPLARPARVGYLQEQIRLAGALCALPLGGRLAPAVVDWLLADDPVTLTPEALRMQPTLVWTAQCMLLAERAFQGGPRSGDEAAVAAWRALVEAENGLPQVDIAAVLPWETTPLSLPIMLAEAFPGRIPVRAFVNQMIYQQLDPELQDILGRVVSGAFGHGAPSLWTLEGLPDRMDAFAAAWARVRSCGRWAGPSAAALQQAVQADFDTVLTDFCSLNLGEGPQSRRLPQDLAATLAALYCLQRVERAYAATRAADPALAWGSTPAAPPPPAELPESHVAALAAAVGDPDVVDALVDAALGGAADPWRMTAVAAMTSASAPREACVIGPDDPLLGLGVETGGGYATVLELAAERVLETCLAQDSGDRADPHGARPGIGVGQETDDGPSDMATRVREAVFAAVPPLAFAGEVEERACVDAASDWLEARGVRGRSMFRRLKWK